MNLPINTFAGELTMSSRDIADLVDARHDNVKRTMETLRDKGLIAFTQTEEKTNGRPAIIYHVNKRDSYVVVAQLSPEFTAQLVDRWQELEKKATRPLSKAEMTLMVIGDLQAEVAQQRLMLEQAAAERDHAIKTKAQISSSREAVVMGKLSGATKKVRKLEEQLGFNTRHASMIAVENATGRKFGKQGWRPLKKWCVERGLDAVVVPCPRWGTAKAWPALAWQDCYDVDLRQLFGAEDAA